MNEEEAVKKRVILTCAVCGKTLGAIWVCNACIPNIEIVEKKQ